MFVCRCSFFFFKQKTAYEMRISDWSSDVCSSDLASFGVRCLGRALRFVAVAIHVQPQVCPVVRIFELVVVATLIEGGVAVVDDGRVKRTIARVGIVEERARQAVIVGDLPGSLEEGQILVGVDRAQRVTGNWIDRSEEPTSELQALMRNSL